MRPLVARVDSEAALRNARTRGESLHKVLDRNLAELLQEMRVAITGVQILFAFLLGLAFTSRFPGLDRFAVTVYTVTLLATALATIVLIAPVAFHRLVFRRRQKGVLIMVGHQLLLLGLGLLVLAISCAVLLIVDVVLGRWQGIAAGGFIAVVGTLTWFGLPVWGRQAGIGEPPDDEESDPDTDG